MERDSAGETIIFQNQTKNGFMHTMHRYSEIRMEHILTQRTFAPVLSTNKNDGLGDGKKPKAKIATQNPSSVCMCVTFLLCLNAH